VHIQKTDKKYWEKDKLSTFLNSDIDDNETLKQLFIKAGCNSLFLLKKETLTDKAKQHNIASIMSTFIGKSTE